jgi:putative membrane protein
MAVANGTRSVAGSVSALFQREKREGPGEYLPAPIAPAIRRSRRGRWDEGEGSGTGSWRWLGIFAAALFALAGVIAVDWVLGLAQRSIVLGATATSAVLLALFAVGLAVRAEIGAIARLKGHLEIHDFFDEMENRPLSKDGCAWILEWLNSLPSGQARTEVIERVSADAPAHQIADLVEERILRDMDRAAVERIRVAVTHSFGLIALSPTPITDTALFAWRATRLVREVAEIYGLHPSTLGALWLLRQVVSDAALIAAADLATDAIATVLGDKLVARLSSPLAEGSVAAYRMARFGLLAIERCRPVPFRSGDEMGLFAVLKAK